MKIDDIEARLPNGLHDAKLSAIHRNLVDETTSLEIEVLTGLPGDKPGKRDRFQSAILSFTNTKILVIEPPDVESSFRFPGTAAIVITEDEPDSLPGELLAECQDKIHVYTVFVQDWLSNIRIAASSVEFKWRNEEKGPA